MAYVVARRNGRFEIRESLHTPAGPRARSLSGFDVLTDEVLVKAAGRAKRPFNREAVLASGRRAGAPMDDVGQGRNNSHGRFVEVSRRMAMSLGRSPVLRSAAPGAALIDLLGFADAVTRNQPARPFEPLTFPSLSRIAADRRGAARRD